MHKASSGSFTFTKYPIKYPDALKDPAWQKKKSFVDKKFTGKTGLGPALKEAATAFDAVNYQLLMFDAKTMGTRDVANYKKHKETADAQLKLAQTAKTKLTTAMGIAKTCNTNAKLSTDAKTHAGTVATKLQELINWLTDINLTDFEVAIQAVKADRDKKLQEIATAAKDVNTMLAALLQTPTHKTWIEQTPDVKTKAVLTAAEEAHRMGGEKFKAIKDAADKLYNDAKGENHTILTVYGHKVPRNPISAEGVKKIEDKIKEFVKRQVGFLKSITG